ncbi:MAG: PAS domain S-box protein [Hydrogenophaga sp.]|uniref:PAS domain-containing sensor histidine kinase n=1 Tax=Hydrogenophaga sp. TaxID=1904254 RepID=UPI00262410A9|nr:PAS domain S-box protein [Hydrogenophaga sp.]MDM7943849.1 PAS domain S-box protein [Hydrogenophaga sp.]
MSQHEDAAQEILREKDRRSALMLLCAAIGVAGALVLAMELVLAAPGEHEAWVAGGLTAMAWICFALTRMDRTRFVAHAIVASVLGAAIFSTLTYGSVRTAVGFLFMAAVVGAGIFLGRTALIVTTVASVGSLGVLTWAETAGLLTATPNFDASLRVWITHATSILVCALMVHHSRVRTRRALDLKSREFERRKATELERDRNLDRFARIFRTSPSPMIAQSARTGSILDVNPAFERSYGYTREQVLGRQESFLWHDATQREAYLQRLFAERHMDQYSCLGRRADGTVFQALISSEMGTDHEDKLIITTISDVSAQADAMERLKRSEERFAKAFNFSPLNLTITRLSDGSFVEINQAQDTVQGFGLEEQIGKTSLDTGVWRTPADRERFVAQLLRDGRIDSFETVMRHKDGSLIDTRLWAELIEIDGEACILSCTINVTAEKRRESLLLNVARGVAAETGEAFFEALTRHLSEAIGCDMVVIGECRDIQQVQVLSIWKDARPLPTFSFDTSNTPCAETLAQRDVFVCAQDLPQGFPQARGIHREGFQSYLGQALRDADGTPIGILFAMWRKPLALSEDLQALVSIFASRANAELVRLHRDREIQRLTETLEQRVRERTADLQKLNAELDSFAYTVSHDLKSPLRAIDGFTRLLDEQLGGRLNQDEREMFDRVLSSTTRMGALISALLALARVSQASLERQTVDLSQLVRAILAEEQGRQPARQLQCQVADGLQAECDPQLTRIALENLLGNALKYSRDRPETVIEFGQTLAEDGRTTRYFVRDNGVGFNMAYAARLFQPFQRLHMANEFEGTGIGLATVRRIVERHGGTITACSAPGEGATFSFSLG